MNRINQQLTLFFIFWQICFVAGCNAQSAAESKLTKLSGVRINAPANAVLTVAKVKAPVYAVRSLVVRGFKD